MWDKTKKRWSELDKKSMAWFLGSSLIVVVRRYFLLGLDKTYQYILMGIGFILLLNSIYRVVFQRRQSWRDVSNVSVCIERTAIRFGFYLLFDLYFIYFVKIIADANSYDTSVWVPLVDGFLILLMVSNNFMDCINLLLKRIHPRAPYFTIGSAIALFYLLSLLSDYKISDLIFVVFGKLLIDMMFSEDVISNIKFLKDPGSLPRKRLIRIKYRLYTLISSIVMVQIIRLTFPNVIKVGFKNLTYGNNEYLNRVVLSLYMMVATIVVFLILDMIVTDAMGEFSTSKYGMMLTNYRQQGKGDKKLLWGSVIVGQSYIFSISFADKLGNALGCIEKNWIKGVKAFAMISVIQILLFPLLKHLIKKLVFNYKKVKGYFRNYLIGEKVNVNQE